MREAQFLGEQIERRVALRGQRVRLGQMLARAAQRLHVARARDEYAFGLGMPAGQFEQAFAQALEAVAAARVRARRRLIGAVVLYPVDRSAKASTVGGREGP